MPTELPLELVKDPLTILTIFDEDVNSGRVKLSKWQIKVLTFLSKAKGLNDPAVRAMLLAANGSGKSQYIIAPFAIWMLLRFTESLTIITTSSGNQLDAQDLRYCTRLARKVNAVFNKEFGEDIIECQYRKFFCKPTESYINMFATDETGKAEGWHPLKPDGEFAIIIDEGKTVDDEIYFAIENCTGFSRRLDVSSAGQSSGTFYMNWHNKELDGLILKERVTAFDCPHIPVKDIQTRIKTYGISHPRLRNSIFSEFTSADQQVVIPRELFLKSVMMCKKFYDFGPLRAGLDLAAGGDENAISVWKGNKEVDRKWWVKRDTTETVDDIVKYIRSFKGELKEENIYADDGGLGRPMLDFLVKAGYKVNRIWNQSRPVDGTHYANRGTELWFNFKRFLEEYQVLFQTDEKGEVDSKLLQQLTNRYYKIQDTTGKIILESKQKAKAERDWSPDRADAVILAWSPYIYPITEIAETEVIRDPRKGKSIEELLHMREEQTLAWFRQGGSSVTCQRPKTYTQKQMSASKVLSHANIYKN